MAGPGGGPPRRSHTKSRKGCETCKRRHIRCDENFPQCRNCTKHKIRCPYNEIPLPERAATPEKPDLMWTPEIEHAIDNWHQSGCFPFAKLGIFPAPAPQFLTRDEMRLIYHVATISEQLVSLGVDNFTLWTHHIPTIIRIAASHRYVLDALLAFSAMHMTFLNECPLVGNLADVYRSTAISGLREAIAHFSRETSDAILAGSLVLSWQATDWQEWVKLMTGTSTVMNAMEEWKEESQFTQFMEESSTFPRAPPSPRPDHKPSQPRKEDIDVYQRTVQQLQKVEAHLRHSGEDTKQFAQLISFTKGTRKVSPTLSVEQQFDRLQPLRKWMLWLPVVYLQQTGGTPSTLVMIAHYYTVALLMERLFPEIGASYFGSLTMKPVDEIANHLQHLAAANPWAGDFQATLSLMDFPREMVTEFRDRMGWPQPLQTSPAAVFDTSALFPAEGLAMEMPPTTSGLLPYAENPPFSWSTEDLSVITNNSGPNSAISPLQLSPYTNAQYLSIPSPSYGGQSPTYGSHSPASSNFGDSFDQQSFDGHSIVYSDSEDFGCYDNMGFASGSNIMMGGPNMYGGFVTPIQTVWT